MFNFLIKLLDFVYKKKCYFCRKSDENTIMCEKCFDKIEPFDLNPLKEFSGVKIYSCCAYAKEIQKLIRAVKYHGKKELAYFQAKVMYEYFSHICDGEYAIVPVPLHKKRFKGRRYNHMELVAAELSKMSGMPVKTNLVERIKDTKPQYKLKMHEREENLQNAFRVFAENYKGEKLLIIDDILTTGSTLLEMIKCFQEKNITDITALTTSTVWGNSVNQK